MTKDDWLFVGVKLVGVYFGVLGLTVFVVMACGMALEVLSAPGLGVVTAEPGIDVVSFAQPLAYLVGAFLLIRRTRWCLKWIHPERHTGPFGLPLADDTENGSASGAPPSPPRDDAQSDR